jgi:hypothetical protein
VKGVAPRFFGSDRNRNGRLDPVKTTVRYDGYRFPDRLQPRANVDKDGNPRINQWQRSHATQHRFDQRGRANLATFIGYRLFWKWKPGGEEAAERAATCRS